MSCIRKPNKFNGKMSPLFSPKIHFVLRCSQSTLVKWNAYEMTVVECKKPLRYTRTIIRTQTNNAIQPAKMNVNSATSQNARFCGLCLLCVEMSPLFSLSATSDLSSHHVFIMPLLLLSYISTKLNVFFIDFDSNSWRLLFLHT